MKRFFSNKFNIALVSLLGASAVTLLISSWVDFFIPISLVVVSVTCFYGAFLLIRKMLESRRNSAVEFIDEEDVGRRRRQNFFEKESRSNLILTIASLIIVGGILIYMAIEML